MKTKEKEGYIETTTVIRIYKTTRKELKLFQNEIFLDGYEYSFDEILRRGIQALRADKNYLK